MGVMGSEKPMNESSDFSFGDNSVADAYADVLVPILFEPCLFDAYRAKTSRITERYPGSVY